MLTTAIDPANLAGNLLIVEVAGEALRLYMSTVCQLINSGLLENILILGCRAKRILRQAIERLLSEGLTGGQS